MNWYKTIISQEIEEYNFDREYEIKTSLLGALRGKVEKLQRKAERLGLEPMELIVSEPYAKELKSNKPEPVMVEVVRVRIMGSPPKIENWQFVARIDHMEGGNIMNTAPGFDSFIPLEFRDRGPMCEQCGINRYRKNTYVVRNIETNEFKQVGGECMKDFLGHPNPQQYANYLDWISSTMLEMEDLGRDSENFVGGRDNQVYSFEEVLPIISAIIDKFGFASSSNRMSTGMLTNVYLNPNTEEKRRIAEEYLSDIVVDESNHQKGRELLEWGRNLPKDIENDYLQNLRTILSNDYLDIKHMGYVASAFSAKDRYEGKRQEREKREVEQKKSEFVGEVGNKVLMKVKFSGKKGIETQYGMSTMYFFEDESGNRYTMFSTSEQFRDLVEGSEIILKATIKSHYERNGYKSTTLSRGKIVPEEEKYIRNARKGIDLDFLPQK